MIKILNVFLIKSQKKTKYFFIGENIFWSKYFSKSSSNLKIQIFLVITDYLFYKDWVLGVS